MKKLLLFITMFMPFFAMANVGVSPISLDWELISNNKDNTYNCVYTVKNISGENMNADWAFYFNSFPRSMTVDKNCPFDITIIQPGYFKVAPKNADFKLGKGKTVKIKYSTKGFLNMYSYGPDGAHFAFTSDKTARPLKINRKPMRTDVVLKRQNYPTAAYMFAKNAEINPTSLLGHEDPFEILPAVKEVKPSNGTLSFARKFTVKADATLQRESKYTEKFLSKAGMTATNGTPVELSLMSRSDAKNDAARDNKEYYELSIKNNGVEIKGVSRDAVLNGVKTLQQLIAKNEGKGELPTAEICDWADLHYRGMMLDIARNFSTAENAMRLVEKLAEFKINVMHLHFCDDEGWRLEINGIPELTQVGARRGLTTNENDYMCQFYNGNGNPDDFTTTSNGYFSREQFIDFLKLAQSCGVKIIPEVETPGHARAIIKSLKARYNNLKDTDLKAAEEYIVWDEDDTSKYTSAQGYHDNVLNVAQEGTFRFLEKVVDEIILMYQQADVELPYIHVGGDEVPRNPWAESPLMTKFMAEKGLKTTRDVEEYFIDRFSKIIEDKGYKVGGWQESAMKHSEATPQKLRPRFEGVYCWNTVPEWKGDTIPYSNANNGYKVVLCNVSNFYLDLAYNPHQDEPGLTWGGYVDELRSWDARPFDIYQSTFTTINGKPLDMANIEKGKVQLTEESKRNIVGVQAQLFTETIRNFDMVEYYVFPKILGLAERGWNCDLLPGQSKAKFSRMLGAYVMPKLKKDGYNFRIGMPGIAIENGKLIMNSPYPEAEIRYTTNDTEPTAESQLWTAPVKAKGKLIKAKLFYLGKQSCTTELKR